MPPYIDCKITQIEKENVLTKREKYYIILLLRNEDKNSLFLIIKRKMERNYMEKQKELLELLNRKNTIDEIQKYIKNVIELRGFANQRVQDKMLLLLEETGELAKAIRKTLPEASIDYNKIENYTEIEEEIADVFIVLISICNELDINLYNALINKEEKNVERKWKINEETALPSYKTEK